MKKYSIEEKELRTVTNRSIAGGVKLRNAKGEVETDFFEGTGTEDRSGNAIWNGVRGVEFSSLLSHSQKT
jgi:hypothetical protein